MRIANVRMPCKLVGMLFEASKATKRSSSHLANSHYRVSAQHQKIATWSKMITYRIRDTSGHWEYTCSQTAVLYFFLFSVFYLMQVTFYA